VGIKPSSKAQGIYRLTQAPRAQGLYDQIKNNVVGALLKKKEGAWHIKELSRSKKSAEK